MTWTGTTSSSTIGFFTQPPLDTPYLHGQGPAECSSCTDLSVQPAWIADVNSYYRDLGVDPRATRRQMREAYVARGGPDDRRLTYVFTQLLDPEVRRRYDLTPLGQPFMDDYLAQALNRIAKAKMSKRMLLLHDLGVDLDTLDDQSLQRDVFAEMGYRFEESDDPDTPTPVVDPASAMDQDERHPAKFEYSYYLWRTRMRQDPETLGILAAWQADLVSALAAAGLTLHFAVGFHGLPHRWLQALVGYRTVFFLNSSQSPTPDLAADVVAQVRAQMSRAPLPSQRKELFL